MSKIYAMSGGATGIGASVKEKLRARGDQVIVVDIKGGDITADLSNDEGRTAAIEGVIRMAPDGLDGFIACAGLPPVAKPLSLISQVNFFGAVATLEGLLELVARKKGAMVSVCSNSAPMGGLDEECIALMLAGDEAAACARVDTLDDGHNAYAGSKNALSKWTRRKAPEFMRKGVRINGIAPGMTSTPLTDRVFDDKDFGPLMRDFSETIPYGSMASPEMIADALIFLLDPEARFVSGAILFVDGGQDALLRPDEF